MYCTECGCRATSKFCANCGHAHESGATPDDTALDLAAVELVTDWREMSDYESLLRVDEVRTTIAQYARRARKPISGEQFLSIAEKLMPVPVPMEPIAKMSQRLWSKMGVRSQQQLERSVPARIGESLLRTLCSLALHSQELREITQGSDGCCLAATLPSDLWSLEGELCISLQRLGDQTRVVAASRIEGQLFDWGKGRRALETLLQELSAPLPPVRRLAG